MAIGKLLESDPRRLGPYRLTGVLGRGGMGEVFLGRDRRGRPVAVKRMRPSLMHAREARRRFAREVTAARTVDSPLVAKVLDAAPEADQPWLATEYVPGIALSEAVETYGPLPEEYVRAVGRQLTDALAAIHRAGLVHRDFKPSNVLLSAAGPRVLDFGLARHLHASTFTTSQEFLGTPAFAAPEQWDAANITPAADVFSLASTLVFALRKRAPFEAEDMWRVMYAIRFEEPDLSGLPVHWADLAGDCLAKEPRHRPSLREVAAALDDFPSAAEAVVLPDGLAALLPAPAGPRPRGLSRRRVLRAGAGVALGAGVAGLASGDRRPGPEVWSYGTLGVVHQILLADTTLYAVDDRGCVYALDARTGELYWFRRVTHGGARPWLGMLPGADPGLYVTGDRLHALYSTTGEERWSVGITAVGTPAVSPRAVCCVARDTDGRNQDELALVDPYTGEQITLNRAGPAQGLVGERGSFTAPAVADDGTIVLGRRGGTVHGIELVKRGIDLADARAEKILRLPGHARFSPAAPLVTQGIAYFGTATKGGLVAVDVRSMQDIWARRLGLDGETWSTPALGDRRDRHGLVYATGSASVHAVDRSTGEPAWNYYPGSPTPGSPVVANDVLYVLTRRGELIAMDAREGGPPLARRAYAPFGGGPVPAPVAAHGLVHFATADRVLRAVPQARARAT
ncbi:hypothetical protein GCM10010252_67820 [Streptomyces aureoverticillatus]|nr:hypothetical protein GCM10010252_67820 [Streptomyces aureoverticillatus]